jgi:diguanylate cyclase (GGDEF)-like protein
VNDSRGFETGDELLKLVANRLQARLRPGHTLARLGADEFIAAFENLPSADAAADLARALLEEFDRGFALANGEIMHVGASIGISLFPDDGATVDQLLQQAGAAVSYAKEMGGRGMRFHTASMVDSAQARFAMETSLREALALGQLVLHYQPRVALDTGRIEGVESLLRWRRTDGQLVAPAEFIPVAEATGLIGPIGDWVLVESCRQMQRWLADGLSINTMAGQRLAEAVPRPGVRQPRVRHPPGDRTAGALPRA